MDSSPRFERYQLTNKIPVPPQLNPTSFPSPPPPPPPVGAVENFINTGGQTFVITTSPALSDSVYYSNYDPSDITITTAYRPSGTCSGNGDPHYYTFEVSFSTSQSNLVTLPSMNLRLRGLACNWFPRFHWLVSLPIVLLIYLLPLNKRIFKVPLVLYKVNALPL